jgi:hypothetical protein
MLKKDCPGHEGSQAKKVCEKMDYISKKLLEKIQKGTLRLTSVAQHFGVGSLGCAGLNDIPKNGKYPTNGCPVKRNHLDRSNIEGIRFPKPNPFYKFKMGE